MHEGSRVCCYLMKALVIVFALALCSGRPPGAYGLCPSNGNTHVIYVTSNMGQNIWSFDTQGNYLGEVLRPESFPDDVKVDKLRAMVFGPGGYLYISSSKGSLSRVFAVSGNGLINGTLRHGCTRDYLFTVTQFGECDFFLDHPYDMVFHPETHALYVSNQNSVTITRYDFMAPSGKSYPRWTPAANVKGTLPNASAANVEIVNVPPTIPKNVGLFASSWSYDYLMMSVRGIAISPKLPSALVDGTAPAGLFSVDSSSFAYYLLVCDITANMIHVFDPDTGVRLFGIGVPSPVQVSFPSRFYVENIQTSRDDEKVGYFEVPYIYVTSKDDGMAYLIRFTSHTQRDNDNVHHASYDPSPAISSTPYDITVATPLHSASGLYEYSSRGVVMVADRTGRRVSTYASPLLTDYKSSSGRAPFLGTFAKNLPDQPEFIVGTLLEHQSNIPFCYEVSPNGAFRYVALCTAAYIWATVLGVAFALGIVFAIRHLIWRQLQSRICRKGVLGGSGLAVSDRTGESVSLLRAAYGRRYGTIED